MNHRIVSVLIVVALVLPFLTVAGPTAHAQVKSEVVRSADAQPLNGTITFKGFRKGQEKINGATHHYVDFDAKGNCANSWALQGPQNPQVWKPIPRCPQVVRAYYAWPFNWPSPWFASAWKLVGTT